MRRPRHPRHHFKYFPDLKLVLIVLASWLILLAASSTRPIPSAFGDKAHSPKPADSLVSFSTSTKTKQATQSRVSETFGKLPLYFIENRGQVDARVSYYVQGSDKAIFFTETGLTFVLNGAEPEAGRGGETKAALQPASYSSPSDTAHPAPRTRMRSSWISSGREPAACAPRARRRPRPSSATSRGIRRNGSGG